jgi:drug/metabolite transporter (DMT)-like permease
MTTFFILTCFGYLLLAIVAILDKFILTKSLSTGTYTFYSTIFFFGSFVLLPFTNTVQGEYILWGIGSSLAFGFAAWPMYIGMKKGEATHVVPFIGATTTISAFIFSSLLLGEVLSNTQLIGIFLLVLASIIFAHEKSKTKNGLWAGYAWAGLAGLLFGLSHVAAKYFYMEYDFVTGLVWTKGFAGIVAFFTLLSVVTRKELFVAFFKKKNESDTEKQKNKLWMVVLNKVLAVGGTVLIQYAIAIGSVVIVNALVGLQYTLVLMFALVLTKLFPKFFNEYFTKKEIGSEVVAIILVVIGILFLI